MPIPLLETSWSTFPRRLKDLDSWIGLTVIICLIVPGLGCSPPPPPPPTGITNAELGLSIGSLGKEWALDTNNQRTLILVPSNPERRGTVEFIVGPEENGINLVAAVNDHRQEIEARPGGVYSGAQELSGPMGTAFYSRGRYDDGDSTLEETRLFSIHPRSSRMLQIVYRYPAGDDSSQRVGELINLLGEVE
jgi:hypothetical protein